METRRQATHAKRKRHAGLPLALCKAGLEDALARLEFMPAEEAELLGGRQECCLHPQLTTLYRRARWKGREKGCKSRRQELEATPLKPTARHGAPVGPCRCWSLRHNFATCCAALWGRDGNLACWRGPRGETRPMSSLGLLPLICALRFAL